MEIKSPEASKTSQADPEMKIDTPKDTDGGDIETPKSSQPEADVKIDPAKTSSDKTIKTPEKTKVDADVNNNKSSSEIFTNWEEMKVAHKGTITAFIKENKPLGSPDIKNWFKNKGTIEISTTETGLQIWKYTTATGESVSYVDGKVVFPREYLYEDDAIAEFSISNFTANRSSDMNSAIAVLKEYGYDRIPDGYILHHDYVNGRFQLVREDIHKTFTHYGGVYYNKMN